MLALVAAAAVFGGSGSVVIVEPGCRESLEVGKHLARVEGEAFAAELPFAFEVAL